MPDKRDLISYHRYLNSLKNRTVSQLNPQDLHYVSVLLRNKFWIPMKQEKILFRLQCEFNGGFSK